MIAFPRGGLAGHRQQHRPSTGWGAGAHGYPLAPHRLHRLAQPLDLHLARLTGRGASRVVTVRGLICLSPFPRGGAAGKAEGGGRRLALSGRHVAASGTLSGTTGPPRQGGEARGDTDNDPVLRKGRSAPCRPGPPPRPYHFVGCPAHQHGHFPACASENQAPRRVTWRQTGGQRRRHSTHTPWEGIPVGGGGVGPWRMLVGPGYVLLIEYEGTAKLLGRRVWLWDKLSHAGRSVHPLSPPALVPDNVVISFQHGGHRREGTGNGRRSSCCPAGHVPRKAIAYRRGNIPVQGTGWPRRPNPRHTLPPPLPSLATKKVQKL
eukprot:Hpha_TRINITY_DN12193_c0_g2::TRINITY_DN12193_c0_g2_i1::g.81885::m.81885